MAFNDTYRESIQTKHIANVGFTSTAKGVTNEAFALKNPHQVIASQIPAVDVVGTYGPLVADGISAGLVEKHTVKLTADPTVNDNKAWYATEDNCTETGHSARGAVRLDQWMRYAETQYKLRLFEDNGSGTAPNMSAEILPSEASFNWEYDPSAGIVYFDENPASNGKTTPLWGILYTYIGNSVEDGLGATTSGVQDLVELFDDTNEPSGFVNTTDSAITFSDATRTLTVSGTSFEYYIEGTKYTKAGAESVQIGAAEGLHYVYYEGDTLTTSNVWSYEYIYNKAYVAAVYWDATNSKALYIGDERHGITMDGQTHAYLHAAFGTQFVSGFAITGVESDAAGSSDNHANFAIETGVIRDEDLVHNLDEKLKTAAIPTFYKSGATGDWRIDGTPDQFPLLSNTGARPYWNENDSGTWKKTIVSANGKFVLAHVFATNSTLSDFIAVAGQAEYDDITAARDGANEEINNLILVGLPFTEFIPVATFIYECNDTYTNSIKARIVTTDTGDDYVDWRFSGLTPNPNSVTHHGNLTGRDDVNQHPATSIYMGTTAFGPILDSADDTVQKAVESLEDGIVAVSGTLQSNIDSVASDLSDLDAELTTASGYLQSQIDSNASDISDLDTELTTASGYLQSQIDSNASDISDLDSELTTASGYLQSQIDSNDTDISNLDAELTTASGYLQTQITNNYNTLDSKIDTTSGTLQSEIDALDTSLTDAIVWETVDTPFEQIRPKVAHQGKAIYTYGSMTIGGDLTVSGTTTTVHSEELTVADKIITVNAGEAGAGITGERYAGIEVDRGTEENYFFVYDEVENNFRVGISGSLQAVATREDSPTDQYIAFWNASEYRFDTAGGIAVGDIASETFVTTAITTLSGALQDQIDDVVTDLGNNYYTKTELDNGQLDNRYYTETETDGLLSTLSGTLQSDIDQNASDISDLDAELTTASGYLQGQISQNASDISDLDSELTTASGYLQGQITQNASDISDLDTELTTTSGYLQGQIDTNASDISDLDAELTTASGYLQDQIDALDDVYATDAELAAVSGTLQSTIDYNYTTLDTKIDTASGTLQSQISQNASDITDNYNTLSTAISTTSGTLQTQITNNYNTLDSKIDTTSGTLQDAIDALAEASDEFTELTDTISSYNAGRVLFESDAAVVDDANFTFVSGTQTLTTVNLDLSGNASIDGTLGFDTGTTINEFVTTVDGASTDDQAPTAKAVYDFTTTAITAVSGTLQGEIDALESTVTDNYNTLDSKIDTTSGTLQSEIDDLSTTVTNNYNTLDSKIDTTSGTLQTAITENYNYLDSKIDTTSGTLQDAIDALDTSLTDDIVWEVVDTPFEQIRPKAAHQGKAIYTYGSMTIGGDLTVSGTTTTVHSEELTVADKIITVNAGEAGAGITGERYAGIEVDRGTEENYFFVYDEVENNFRVGISGSLQAVATREDAPTDQYVAFWNASEYRFDTAGGISVGDIASTAYVDTEITTLSGALQSDIDAAIADLANNYYNKTEIDAFNTDIYSTITTASGVLQDQIDALDDTYATDAELAAVSGTLQSAIDQNASDISDLDAELTTASGYLQNQIDALDDVYATDAELAAVSGTLQGEIDAVVSDLANNYYTITQLDNGQLDNRYYTETEIDSMLEAQDTFLELTDTISSYNAGRVLFTTASGVVDAAGFTFDSGTGLLSTTSIQLGTGGYVNEVVTTVTSGTTDYQVPTAKAVWDLTEAAAAAVHTHYDVDAVYVSDTSWTYGTGFAEVPESLVVYVNGVKQRQGASYDCSVDVPGGVLTITFNYNVYSSDWVNVTYIM